MNDKATEREVVRVLRVCVDALRFLHDRGFVHCGVTGDVFGVVAGRWVLLDLSQVHPPKP